MQGILLREFPATFQPWQKQSTLFYHQGAKQREARWPETYISRMGERNKAKESVLIHAVGQSSKNKWSITSWQRTRKKEENKPTKEPLGWGWLLLLIGSRPTHPQDEIGKRKSWGRRALYIYITNQLHESMHKYVPSTRIYLLDR